MIKNCVSAAVIFTALALPAGAATFTMKRGINLDQWVTWPQEESWGDPDVLFPFPEWRRFVGRPELLALKNAGFDFVRMPVPPAPFLAGLSEQSRDRLYQEVRDAARLINDAGLKVVVDLHLIPHGDGSPTGMDGVLASGAAFDAYVETVRTMGRTLSKEDPSKVAFELMNEPGTECDAAGNAEWDDRLGRLFAAARASATRLTLVLPGGCGGNAEGLAAVDPRRIPDENVIWTFHSYQPFLLTHQGAEWAGDFIRYVTGLPFPLHEAAPGELDRTLETIRARIRAEAPWARQSGMLSYLDEQIAEIDTAEKLEAVMDTPFRTVDAWAKHYGIAPENIFLGEFGMIRQEYENPFVMPAASRAAYARQMIGLAERRGFAWSIWGYGGAFGVVDAFNGDKAEPDTLDMVRGLPR